MFNVEKPKLIQQIYLGWRVRFDLAEGVGHEEEPGWEYSEIEIPDLRYETIVSGIIHSKYRTDAEIAIINNHLIDPDARVEEWETYQGWRAFAKEYTSDTLGIKKGN